MDMSCLGGSGAKPLVLDQPTGCIDDIGVKLHGTLAFKLVQCRVDAKSRSIRAMGGHRFDHVGHRQNANFQAECIAPQPIGIAGAIQTLVVL